ncbi:Cyclin-dependent protein kinase [Actinomortierella ambigua]|uniref:Cyclin-dependent protein kinase n=1 Tax=Actinomortierella ambigua TaxID=1343610 RepID=A0A9P6QP08_9FUNG|nr:Cyclin-dependent protein kinase [Actinomortierella ambigua]
MASRQRKRKLSRKEQSLRDKERTLMNDSTFYQPLKEYTHFLAHLKSHGYANNEFTSIPFNLIDLASALIAAMITGRDLTLFRNTPPEPNTEDEATDTENTENHHPKGHHHDTLNMEETETFYFIHRILKRTQLSCTTLILALIYIDRIKARLTNSLKKRTRLDQGPELEHSPYTFQSDLKGHRRTHSNSSSSNGLASATTTPPSTSPSRSGNSPHHQTSFPASSTRHGIGNKTDTETWSSISLFLVAVICADKYLFDATFTNGEWADFTRGMYTTAEINELERRFLGRLQYRMYVSEPEFDGFLSYLEVVLQLQQVWGRGFWVDLSYSDVQILTQQLMPAYAGRLHFRTLQQDVVMVLWQVTLSISRVYLAVVGTVMVAAASYAALLDMTMAGSTSMAWNTMAATYGFCPSTMAPPSLYHYPHSSLDHAVTNTNANFHNAVATAAHTWNGLLMPMLHHHYQHLYQAQYGPGALYGPSNADAVLTATHALHHTLATTDPATLVHATSSGGENMAGLVMDWLGHQHDTLVQYEMVV